jgi:hypothetical protein
VACFHFLSTSISFGLFIEFEPAAFNNDAILVFVRSIKTNIQACKLIVYKREKVKKEKG